MRNYLLGLATIPAALAVGAIAVELSGPSNVLTVECRRDGWTDRPRDYRSQWRWMVAALRHTRGSKEHYRELEKSWH